MQVNILTFRIKKFAVFTPALFKQSLPFIIYFIQVIVLNSTDGYMIGETQSLLRNLAKETNNGAETATLSVILLLLLLLLLSW